MIVQLKMVRLWLFLGLGLGLFIEALFKYEFYPQFTQLIALRPRYVDYDSRGHVFDTIAQNFSFIQFIFEF